MADFLDAAEDVAGAIQDQDHRKEFDLVFDVVQRLMPLHAKSLGFRLSNVEDVFSLIEMGNLIQSLPATADEEIPAIQNAIRRVLAETIDHRCRFGFDGSRVKPMPTYEQFVRFLKTGEPSDYALITFNYDICLDHALWDADVPFNYGFDENPRRPGMRLLKLHGSVNWALCPTCAKILPVTMDKVFHHYMGKNWTTVPKHVSAEIRHRLIQQRCPCGSTLAIPDLPALVPPTWNKATQPSRSFSAVWRCAAAELSEAVEITVVGYSLPETDLFFRHLLGLGLAGPTRLRAFTVVDPSEKTAERFRSLLGPEIRDRFAHRLETFDGYGLRYLSVTNLKAAEWPTVRAR